MLAPPFSPGDEPLSESDGLSVPLTGRVRTGTPARPTLPDADRRLSESLALVRSLQRTAQEAWRSYEGQGPRASGRTLGPIVGPWAC